MRILLIFLLLILHIHGASQKPAHRTEQEVNPYEIYIRQFSDLMAMRGMPEEEIRSMLGKFKDYDINSNENLAKALAKLYPADQGIGIICFFLNKDTLRRILFEPGIIKEEKIFIIKKEQLLQLGNDINHGLGLYKKSADRMPHKRGFKLKDPPQSLHISFDSIIRFASHLLLPENMDAAYRHLLILPVLNIGTIPFAILKPFADGSFLVDKCSFTIVPGVIDLISLRGRLMKSVDSNWSGDLSDDFNPYGDFSVFSRMSFTSKHALFISNPAYPQNTEYSFPDLPGAKKEIDKAKKYTEEYVLLEGSQATRDRVIQNFAGSDLAYFATHGIADDESPMEKSFVVLSGDDPFLTAKDIMQLRESVALKNFPGMVILSACQTGLGKSMEAGVAGLARSFLLAGSSHVVMSLWNVDDEATAYLMNRFIFHLKKPGKFMPAEPLRLAMLDARKKYRSPSQWASFCLFGINY